MKTSGKASSVDFLLDGNCFFEKLHHEIMLAEKCATHHPRAIKLAYWKADPDMTLPAVTGTKLGSRTLAEALVSAAEAKCSVQAVLWDGWKGEVWTDTKKFRTLVKNRFAPQRSGDQAPTDQQTPQILFNAYAGYWKHPFTSLHVKIAIFHYGGRKRVLLGGMNLGDDYKSAQQHSGSDLWHDAGVLFEGSVVDQVEAYWNHLWNRTVPPAAPASADGDGCPVDIVTTHVVDGVTAQRDVRRSLVERILAASRYVYLENQALTDPAIIDALTIAAAKGVRVICVVPHPRRTMLGDYSGYAYIMGFAYRAMALARMAACARDREKKWKPHIRTYDPDDDEPSTSETVFVIWYGYGRELRWDKIKRAHLPSVTGANNLDLDLWDPKDAPVKTLVDELAAGRAESAVRRFMNRTFVWDEGKGNEWVYLQKVNHVTRGLAQMYAPVVRGAKSPYVHSKLALIDDEYAFIGSSNWTYRSMQYDAEISAVIHDPAKVVEIRRELFDHWGMGNEQKTGRALGRWRREATANAEILKKDGLRPGKVYIVPLELDDFDVSWKNIPAWGTWMDARMI